MAVRIPFPRERFGIEGIHKQGVKKTNSSDQQGTTLGTSELG